MSFKERALLKLAVWWWSVKKPQHDESVVIPRHGVRANHLAVILPPDFESFDVARYALTPLLALLQPYQCTFLVRENYRSWLSDIAGAKLLIYDPARKDLLGFPENRSRSEVKNLAADVVVDLTPGFSQFTAGLAAATEAPLRVTLNKEHATRFYNLIVYPARGRSLQEQYHVLLTHL